VRAKRDAAASLFSVLFACLLVVRVHLHAPTHTHMSHPWPPALCPASRPEPYLEVQEACEERNAHLHLHHACAHMYAFVHTCPAYGWWGCEAGTLA